MSFDRNEKVVMGVPLAVGGALYAINALLPSHAVEDVESAQSYIASVDEFFDEQEPGHPSYEELTAGEHTLGGQMVDLAQSPPSDPTEYKSLVYRLYRENTYVQQRGRAMAELAVAQDAAKEYDDLKDSHNTALWFAGLGIGIVGLSRVCKKVSEDKSLF
jgi:hypothetical protein